LKHEKIFNVALTKREIATLNAALGEYLYICEEGNLKELVDATEAFGTQKPLSPLETCVLREKLEKINRIG